MNDKAEKVYGEAFFELCEEQGDAVMKDILGELTALDGIFKENPEFVKLMSTPTVAVEEKISMVEEMSKSGGISELTTNLLCLLAEKNRFGCFSGIIKYYRAEYNERFKLADITVTSAQPLTDALREQIAAKMSQIIGKTVTITEKVDENLIGGVIIDYGSRRYDGSVKSRLSALKNDLASII